MTREECERHLHVGTRVYHEWHAQEYTVIDPTVTHLYGEYGVMLSPYESHGGPWHGWIKILTLRTPVALQLPPGL